MTKFQYVFIIILLITELLSLYYIPFHLNGLTHLLLSTALFSFLLLSIRSNYLTIFLIVASGATSLITITNASRLYSPLYYDQVASVLSSPTDALSMSSFSVTPSLVFLAIVIFISVIALITISLKTPRFNTKTSTVVFLAIASSIYFEIFLYSQSNSFFKVLTSAKHYYIPKNQLIIDRVSPSLDSSKSKIDQRSLPNVLFVMSEAISSEITDINPIQFFESQQSNSVEFKHAFSSGPFTSLSAINFYLLTTSQNAQNPKYPTLFMYAKTAGYKTHYRNSRNSLWGNISGILHQDVDTLNDMTDYKLNDCAYKCSLLGGVNDFSFFDGNIKPYLSDTPFFMTFHTDLVHPPYSRFKENNTQSNYDAYINGIDALSDLLFHIYSNLPDNTLLFLSSDHGALHNHKTLSVPLFVIYKGSNQSVLEYIELLRQYKNKPVQQKFVMTALLTKIGYQLPREIDFDHNKPISVETLSDFVEPKRMDITELKKEINLLN
jgi:hypothetical protein